MPLTIAILVMAVVSLAETLAYGLLWAPYVAWIGRPFVLDTPFALTDRGLLSNLAEDPERIRIERIGDTLLVRRKFGFFRRVGACGQVEFADDGAAKVRWVPYPALRWIAMTPVVGSAWLTMGGSLIAVLLVSTLALALVGLAQVHASRTLFEQEVWPDLVQALAAAGSAKGPRSS